MEVITACENVCRDFYWLPIAAQTLGGLATFGALIIAWLAYANWRRPKIAERASAIAVDLLGELRGFEITLEAARIRTQPHREFDYDEAELLLREARKIWAQMQPRAELIAALLRRRDLSSSVGGLLYIHNAVERNFRRARKSAERGDKEKELKYLLLFIGETIIGDDALEEKRQNEIGSCEAVKKKIQHLRDCLYKMARMEH